MRPTAALLILLAVSACGGNVVVDGVPSGGAGGGTSTTSSGLGMGASTTSAGTTNAPSSGTTSATSTGSGTASSGSGGLCAPTCSLAVQTGQTACFGLPFTNYTVIVNCSSQCQSCWSNLYKLGPASANCLTCLPSACPDAYAACFGM